MAGDGQMDPNDLAAVVQPILDDEADHVKGNRMSTPADIEQMPNRRRRASRILGWLTTLASGRPQTLNVDIQQPLPTFFNNGIGNGLGEVMVIQTTGLFIFQVRAGESRTFV